ncbi:SH3 domain-containing protein [Lutibaculum baratangense]|uniref:SH3 domain-containing protein n=1 Tax=Lutibaculum baratangense TaxID=1358440 RepID=UPI000685940F|nr:SH3 domain-containing protein [Lutibaculum baratangense]
MKFRPASAVVFTAVLMAASAALAHPGVTTGTVNMRIGPGTQHPVVIAIPVSQPVTIVGCLSGSAWCDVVWAGHRGWVSASYIHYAAPGYSVPIATVYHRVPTVSPWVEARRDARVQYRVHRRMDRRWERWTGN